MSCRIRVSKACSTNKVGIGRGVANLIALNEREESSAARSVALAEGFDTLQGEAVAISGLAGHRPTALLARQDWSMKPTGESCAEYPPR